MCQTKKLEHKNSQQNNRVNILDEKMLGNMKQDTVTQDNSSQVKDEPKIIIGDNSKEIIDSKIHSDMSFQHKYNKIEENKSSKFTISKFNEAKSLNDLNKKIFNSEQNLNTKNYQKSQLIFEVYCDLSLKHSKSTTHIDHKKQ